MVDPRASGCVIVTAIVETSQMEFSQVIPNVLFLCRACVILGVIFLLSSVCIVVKAIHDLSTKLLPEVVSFFFFLKSFLRVPASCITSHPRLTRGSWGGGEKINSILGVQKTSYLNVNDSAEKSTGQDKKIVELVHVLCLLTTFNVFYIKRNEVIFIEQ